MRLGDLEFRPDDFVSYSEEIQYELPKLKSMAARANEVLREKLAMTPQVFGYGIDNTYGAWHDEGTVRGDKFPKRARLVCIEPTK